MRSLSKRIASAALAAVAIGGAIASGPASAAPSPNACYGQTAVSFVQAFGGARNASEAFFGDSPQAVQQGHLAVANICGTPTPSGSTP